MATAMAFPKPVRTVRKPDARPPRPTWARTTEQNNTLWLVYGQGFRGLQKLCEQLKVQFPFRDVDEMHWWFKRKARVRSTAWLSRNKFNAYLEWVCAYFTQRGIDIVIEERHGR